MYPFKHNSYFPKAIFCRLFNTFIILLFAVTVTFSQGFLCSEAQEFCPSTAGDNISFSASVDAPDAEFGNNYGCLSSQPNPAWYYIQVGQQGFININLFNSQNEDIDFALWGPFTNLPAAYDECGMLDSPIDCSYSTSAFETVNIPSSNPGDIYLLLITNYSNDPTEITGEATGSGLAFCCSPPQNTGLTCADAPVLDCSCWLDGVTGTLVADNVTDMPADFCGSFENEQWIAFDACWCNATIEVTAENCTLGDGIEVQLFDSCDPFTSISDCIMVADGTTEFLTGNGNNIIECNVDSRYTILLDGKSGDICEYTIKVEPQPTPPPMILEDTIYGPDHVYFGDTVTYDFPPILNGGTCTATFTGSNTQIIDITHTSFTVIYGEESGELCIQVNNCELQTEFCMVVLVEDCENCNTPDMPDDTCVDAPLFCEIFENEFCSHNDYLTPDVVGNLASVFDCPIENNQWFQFIVDETSVSFEFTATACKQYQGIEVAILSTDDCNNFVAHSNCTAVPYGMSATVEATGLTIGETYYIMIDGINGDDCLWSLGIPTGVDEDCCPSFGGDLDANDFMVCENESFTVTHSGNMFLDDDDIALFVLHDGTNTPFGNILQQNDTGVFTFQAGMTTGQTYFIDYGVGDELNGNLDVNDECFSLAMNQNTVIFNSTTPELAVGMMTENCDALAETYTVTFELLNGTLPYSINGVEISGSTFTSEPIPTNTSFSFEISSANECLAPIIEEVFYECPCETDAGSIDVVNRTVCGETPIEIIPNNDEILDNDDVLVFILKDTEDNIISQNATGQFFFQPGMTFGNPYLVCAIAGNDDGTGNPMTDYPCFSTSNCMEVTFYGELSIVLPEIPEITCDFPESAVPTIVNGGTGNYIYEWSNTSGSLGEDAIFRTTQPGNYDLLVEDAQTGCSAITTFNVPKAAEVEGFDFTPTEPICFGENNGFIHIDTVIGGVAPYTYSLNGTVFTPSDEFSFLPTGSYDLMVKDVNGCEYLINYFLPEPPAPVLDLGEDRFIKLGEELSIEPITNLDTEIEFTVGNESPEFGYDLNFLPLNGTTISARIEDENGCVATDEIIINVQKPSAVFAPNVFSPNNDGSNDFFYIFGDNSVEIVESFMVFDRWGAQVFEANNFIPNDQNDGWDGTHKGKLLDAGVYIFFAKIVFVDGREEIIRGDVALMR